MESLDLGLEPFLVRKQFLFQDKSFINRLSSVMKAIFNPFLVGKVLQNTFIHKKQVHMTVFGVKIREETNH